MTSGPQPSSSAEDAGGAPEVIVFDVNETLSDMSALGRRFADLGLPPELAQTWFAALLRDGFALAAAGSMASFARLAANGLQALLRGRPLDGDSDDAVAHILAGFDDLDLHADVDPGTAGLVRRGIRLVTLSNGAAGVAERLLDRSGIADRFERLMSVEEAGVWKPAPGSYRYAVRQCGVSAESAMLVAVHPWDVDGAKRAGLRAAWVNRGGGVFPDHFTRPDLEASSILDLAHRLAD